MLGYIQDNSCTNTIHAIVIISTVPQVFRYISYSTSSCEADLIQTCLYSIRVKINITTDKIKSDIHNDSASTRRYHIDDITDHFKLRIDIIFGINGLSVI